MPGLRDYFAVLVAGVRKERSFGRSNVCGGLMPGLIECSVAGCNRIFGVTFWKRHGEVEFFERF